MSNVRFDHATKRYGDSVIVPDFSLEIHEGEFVALLGPSGCGKTTLLRCLAGLERLDAGTITIGETVVDDPGRRLHVVPNRRDLGLVFQSYALWPHLNVLGNVAYPLRARRVARSERPERVAEALRLVGLEGYERRTPGSLSGGQQQRVALARALVTDPAVLLLDEPLSNLDAQRRTQLRGELRRIHRQAPTTTLYVTHDRSEALALADRVVIMNAGEVLQTGSPSEVFATPRSPFVARFLGYDNLIPARITRIHGDTATLRSDPFGGELSASLPGAATTPAVDDEVWLAVRAEDITVRPAWEATSAGPAAEIEDIVRLGSSAEITLHRAGHRLSAHVPSDSLGSLRPGDEVSFTPDRSCAVVVPSTEQPRLALAG